MPSFVVIALLMLIYFMIFTSRSQFLSCAPPPPTTIGGRRLLAPYSGGAGVSCFSSSTSISSPMLVVGSVLVLTAFRRFLSSWHHSSSFSCGRSAEDPCSFLECCPREEEGGRSRLYPEFQTFNMSPISCFRRAIQMLVVSILFFAHL